MGHIRKANTMPMYTGERVALMVANTASKWVLRIRRFTISRTLPVKIMDIVVFEYGLFHSFRNMIFLFVNRYLDDVLFWLDRVMIPPSMASFRLEFVSTSVSQSPSSFFVHWMETVFL